MNRRTALRLGTASLTIPATTILNSSIASAQETKTEGESKSKSGVNLYFLEIVTPEADAACKLYSKLHGVKFGDPVPEFGGARTAKLAGGGMLSIRGPLRTSEKPVVRPYALVKDINKAVADAKELGAVIAMPPMEIKGQGKFAIFIHGGIESGLWQN